MNRVEIGPVYVVKSGAGYFLTAFGDWGRTTAEAKHFVSPGAAQAAADMWPQANASVVNLHREPPPKVTIDDVGRIYAHMRDFLDALPAGRMKSLAITSLEESCSRAIFSASESEDPLRPKKWK